MISSLLIRQRRAQIGIQFNWLFVIVIGAVILGFFFVIINNQQKGADIQYADDLAEKLDPIFKTISAQKDVTANYSISHAELDFTCTFEDGLLESNYLIQKTGPTSLDSVVVFTPSQLRGSEIYAWTKMWSVPFDVMSFTYLSNDRTLFVFVKSDMIVPAEDPAQILYQQMPINFRTDLIETADVPDYQPSGYDRITFITTDDILTSVSDRIRSKTSIRKFPAAAVTAAELAETGDITFIDPPDHTDNTRTYFTNETLFGALVTQDAGTYECTMIKAIRRLRGLAMIQRERADQLRSAYLYSECFDRLDTAYVYYDGLVNLDPDQGVDSLIDVMNAKVDYEKNYNIAKRGLTCPSIT